MNHRLRRRHRLVIAAITIALAGAAILAVTHPRASSRMETLPAAIVEAGARPAHQP
jgi:hypothetical protein